jgi:DNA-binding NarL/FixJ family response regulator
MHAAGIDDILSVTCRAFGLSRRERELAALVVQGLDTHAIASELCISTYTVQDHLKSIFCKIGVHGRLELVTRLFAQAA